MQMQQMQQIQMPYQQQRPNAYAYPAPPAQQYASYGPSTNTYVTEQMSVSVNTTSEEKEWNHQDNEACLMLKARFCESEMKLLDKRHLEVECRGNTALLKQLVQHRKGAQADISGNVHKGVMINKVVVVGCQSTLPHPTGIRFNEIPANFNYIDGPSGEGFAFIVPANLPDYTFVNLPPIYQANKDAQGALAAKYGGIDFDKLKREIVQMSENSPSVYVPKHSIAVKAAMDAHIAIKISGSKSDNGKYRIDPKLEFIQGSNQLIEIEGKISMSTEFFNGFLRSVQENVMSVTKPVDLDSLEMSFFNTNYGHTLASRDGTLLQEDNVFDAKKRHEVVVDFIIYFNTRQDL